MDLVGHQRPRLGLVAHRKPKRGDGDHRKPRPGPADHQKLKRVFADRPKRNRGHDVLLKEKGGERWGNSGRRLIVKPRSTG
jgi:hypothetical protein